MRLILIFFLFLVNFSNSFSQIFPKSSWFLDFKGENAGHTVANFLTLPISAATLSSSDGASLFNQDATDICNFPSNTSLFRHYKFAATHLEWLMSLRVEYAGICFPINDIGTIGAYSRVFTPGAFTNARDIEQNPSHPSIFDMSLGVSYGRYFLNKTLLWGATLSYLESRLDEISGRTIFLNTDVSYQPHPLFNLHLYGQNIGPGITYSSSFEPLPVSFGISFNLSPFNFNENITDIFDLKLGFGTKKVADLPLLSGGGLNATFFKKFSLRAGYDYVLGTSPSLSGFGAGAAIDINQYGADFGWKYKSEYLGSVWSLSLRLKFKEVITKTAEDYYKTAENYFKKQRYNLCLVNAKKAVSLDPNMWKAHALISSVNSIKRRKSNLEIGLIYTSNIKGNFLPIYSSDGISVGGLSRLATAIKALKSQYQTNFLIDGGNIITSNSNKIKYQLANEYYEKLGYDCASVGEEEIRHGLAELYPTINTKKTQFICSNIISKFSLGNIVSKKIITKSGYKILILSFVNNSFLPDTLKDKFFAPIDALEDYQSKADFKEADLRILIVHDKWENIPKYANFVKNGDIILCANLKQYFASPMKIGNAIALSCGENGFYLGCLTLRFSPNKELLSFDNRLIPCNEEITLDEEIQNIIKTVSAKISNDSLEVAQISFKQSSGDGIFPFLSLRKGENSIYLKIIGKNIEFPLASSIDMLNIASFSLNAGKIAYFNKPPDSSCSQLYVMNLTGAQKRKIAGISCPQYATFSPDGKWLYFSAKYDDSTTNILRIKPDGNIIEPIISWKNSQEKEIVFSSNGSSMLFTSNINGKWQIYSTNQEGYKPICITDGSADYIKPAFNINSKYVAMLSNKTSFHQTYDLYLYNIEKSDFSVLTRQMKVKSFCWLDEQTIVFSAGDTARLYKIDIKTQNITKLLQDTIRTFSETSPQLIFYNSKPKIIYTREYFDNNKLIFWINPDGSNNRVIINSNTQDWLEY